MQDKIKLTPKQNAVIWCLQNGWCIITDSTLKGAWVADNKHQFHINNAIFWNLCEKGLIHQESFPFFNYGLTNEGKSIKTKPVSIPKII